LGQPEFATERYTAWRSSIYMIRLVIYIRGFLNPYFRIISESSKPS
jgi:hypothetical protein